MARLWANSIVTEFGGASNNEGVIPASSPNQPPELRARTLGERIDAAIKIVGANFKVLFPMAAAMVLPFQLVIALSTVSIVDNISTTKPGELPKFTSQQLGAGGVSVVLGLLATVVVTGALTWFIAEFYVGRLPKAGAALSFALKRTPATIGSYIVATIGAVIAGIPAIALLIVGALMKLAAVVVVAIIAWLLIFLWFFIRVSTAVPAIIVEKLGPIASVKRSFRLTKGCWWKVFGSLIVTSFLTGIVAQVLSTVINGILGLLGGDNKGFEFIWIALAGTVSTAVTTPVAAAMAVLMYLELRIKKEGFDLEVLAASLGAPSPTAPSPWGR